MEHNTIVPHTFPYKLNIDDVRESIKGRIDFMEIKNEDHIIFTYILMTEDSFIDPVHISDERQKFLLQLRRECRGLVFTKDGQVIARRYHKFFNINELPETKVENIDTSTPFVILEKLDGSMVSPYFCNGKLCFATKKGFNHVSDMAEQFIKAREKIEYEKFCKEWILKDYTPIFEFCSNKVPIVMRFEEDSMILTALRNNTDGSYVEYHKMVEIAEKSGIPVVKEWTEYKNDSNFNLKDFLHKVEHMSELEGFVLRFEDGRMYKIKTQWYSNVSKDKNMISHAKSSEKHAWKMMVDGKYDDIRPFLTDSDRVELDNFYRDFINEIGKTAVSLSEDVKKWREIHGDDRKLFATDFIKNSEKSEIDKTIYWLLYKGNDPLESVLKAIGDNTADKKHLNKVRHLAGNLNIKLYKNYDKPKRIEE